jgi:cyclopropane fatty-acyl-phospholipid synthase-like methyltransferase
VGYEPGIVLEIGCGDGGIARMLADTFAKVKAARYRASASITVAFLF